MPPLHTILPLARVARAGRLLLITACCAVPLAAQAPGSINQQASGPVIMSAGPSFEVQAPTFATPSRGDMKALFNIETGGGDSVKTIEALTTMARFYNIHARNGVAESRLKAAAVFHGGGWPVLLSDSAFAARFNGRTNPGRKIVEELIQHGAMIVLCGQTAGARNIRRDELLPGVKVAASAMTAFIALQNDGYRFIAW